MFVLFRVTSWIIFVTLNVTVVDMREDQDEVIKNRCSRCDGVMRSWTELTDEEREVVKRLPFSADYAEEERQRLHRWCTRCWHESVEREGHRA